MLIAVDSPALVSGRNEDSISLLLRSGDTDGVVGPGSCVIGAGVEVAAEAMPSKAIEVVGYVEVVVVGYTVVVVGQTVYDELLRGAHGSTPERPLTCSCECFVTSAFAWTVSVNVLQERASGLLWPIADVTNVGCTSFKGLDPF